MTVEILQALLVTQAGVALLLLSLVFGHAAWLGTRARLQQARRRSASAALARLLAGDDSVQQAAAAVGALPATAQAELLTAVARNIRGNRAQALTAVARATGIVACADAWCTSRRRAVRLRGVRLQARVGALPRSLPALLADPWAPVRAEAAQVAAAHAAPARIEALVGLLTDPAPLVRFAAKDALVRCGTGAAAVLAHRLEGDLADDQALADALEVAVPLAGPPFTAAVDRHRAHPNARVRARVATLAAAVGGRRHAEVLEALLGDDAGEVRAAAATGIGDLGHWPSVARVADLLADPAWDVRRAAGLALRRLDAPGALYLRRGLQAEDAFARDMAQQVLDLPDTRALA